MTFQEQNRRRAIYFGKALLGGSFKSSLRGEFYKALFMFIIGLTAIVLGRYRIETQENKEKLNKYNAVALLLQDLFNGF